MIDFTDPLVQGATIGAAAAIGVGAAAVGGAVWGARIAANAQKHAAVLAQQEAQANREEARRTRFAERIRELAAQLLDSGARFDAGVAAYIEWLQHRRGAPPKLNLGHTFPQVVRELELVCRLDETLVALDAIREAVEELEEYVPDGALGVVQVDADLHGEFTRARTQYVQAAIRFTNAVRVELGAPLPEGGQF